MKNYLDYFSLEGKTALVVGGVGLIGSEVTKALAQAGANTVILDIDRAGGEFLSNKIIEEGFSSSFEYFNCSALDKIEKALLFIVSKTDSVDIMVNCSYPRTADWESNTFLNAELSSFRKNVDIHMNSYIWIAKTVADIMSGMDNGGSIIQFGSTYGILGQDLSIYEGTNMKENMTYAAMKGGIINFTRQMASYYGKYGIRVNTICPGGITGSVAGKFSTQPRQFVENYNKKTPLRRLGEPSEVAASTLFLASGAATYITGITLLVDGGWSII